jgi:putative membrane protein
MTKAYHLALILGAALCTLTACQDGTSGQSAGQAQPPVLTKVDVAFINQAGPAGLGEVAFASLAQTRATDPAIRDLATKMIADFNPVNQQIAALAAQSNDIAPATEMDGRHQVMYHQLESLNRGAFDRAFISGQLQDLTAVIQVFQAEADSGSLPQVRSVAQQHLPTLLEDLQMANKIGNQ